MGVKALYSLMSQDLRSLSLVFMDGQNEEKKYMGRNKENEEKEKI